MARLSRFVGVLVIGAALLGVGLLVVAVVVTGSSEVERPTSGVLFGVWRVVYDADPPGAGDGGGCGRVGDLVGGRGGVFGASGDDVGAAEC